MPCEPRRPQQRVPTIFSSQNNPSFPQFLPHSDIFSTFLPPICVLCLTRTTCQNNLLLCIFHHFSPLLSHLSCNSPLFPIGEINDQFPHFYQISPLSGNPVNMSSRPLPPSIRPSGGPQTFLCETRHNIKQGSLNQL